MTTEFRPIRLALDRFASLEGRRQAKDLCALHGAASIPHDVLKVAADTFRDTARRALAEARVEGNQEALLAHLLELWRTSFMVEVKHRRRTENRAQRS